MTPKRLLHRIGRRRRARIGAKVLAAIAIVALFAEPIAALGPHWLGLDGADARLFAGFIHGFRTALGLGISVAAVSLVVGVGLGGLAGMVGGLWESIVVRWVEAASVFPAVILAALVRAMETRPSLLSLFAVATLVRSAEMARLVRLLVVQGSTLGFATSARALGASPMRVLFRHILPNGQGTILASAFFSIAQVVLLETALSFLGLGVPSELPSWGQMLGEARWEANGPLAFAPVVALALTLGALFLLGDALREELDPRERWVAG